MLSSAIVPKGLRQKLWKHQKDAIDFAISRLRQPGLVSRALVRMPTGTGKTGVIAVLSRVLPPYDGWTLILTPWKNLCEQMIGDIKERFWESPINWKPSGSISVERLYPCTLGKVADRSDKQLIIVATFATLITIFRKNREGYLKLAARISQVLVDECHYEPAVEWGQAVKNIKKPTLLLTATPYRNDLKLFRVEKDDVFHYTHEQAIADGIIRDIKTRSLGTPVPKAGQVDAWCKAFVDYWRGPEKERYGKEARAIICCSKMATVELVTKSLRKQGLSALGIHERFRGRKEPWLVQDSPSPREEDAEVWIHQNKLTEGLDDSRFCFLAILNPINNDRKLIQQIGRILRPGKGIAGNSRRSHRAVVLHSEGLKVCRSWENYREFEVQEDIIQSERYSKLYETLLEKQPEMEYFEGRFRRRFQPRSPDLAAQIRLKSSVAVRRLGPDFRLNEFSEFTSDFLLLLDRILLGPSSGPINGPGDSLLWVYAVISNSKLLMEHAQYEVRLGALSAVVHNNLLFITDTEGVYPAEYLVPHTNKLSPTELSRIFEKNVVAKHTSLKNAWPVGYAIRQSSISAVDLGATPAQLTDAVFVCSAVRASSESGVGGTCRRRQYISFSRGRVSEDIQSVDRDSFRLNEFVQWTGELAKSINNEKRKVPEFFRRYLSPITAPEEVSPKYLIINLNEEDSGLIDDDGQAVELLESIVEVQTGDDRPERGPRFSFSLVYSAKQKDKKKSVSGELNYDEKTKRFRVHGDELNTMLLAIGDDASEGQGLTSFLNNNDDRFIVALDDPEIFYTAQSFYRIEYTYAETRLASLLVPIKNLKNTYSEKGDGAKGRKTWEANSVFGVVANLRPEGIIPMQFGKTELFLCDDMGTEVADFLCANFAERKIAFIHAKHGGGCKVSASALHDVVAQAQKNLSVIPRGGAKPAHLERWNREDKWKGTEIRRWIKGSRSLPISQALWQKIRNEILDHPLGKKEVWLVVGKTLEKGRLIEQLENADKRDAVTGQIVHLLSGLQAACIQLGVALKVFCE